MKIILLIISFVSVSAQGADFTISIQSGPPGKDLVVYKKSNNLKLGTVVLMPGGNSLIRVANGELLNPSLSTITYQTLSNCQTNSGTKFINASQATGTVMQNPRSQEYLKKTGANQMLLGSYSYDKDSDFCWFNDSPEPENYSVLQVLPITGFPNLGDSVGRGVSDSEVFEIKAE